MPWCSSLLIHLVDPTYFWEMLPFSLLWKKNYKFSAVFFLYHVIQIGYSLYITIFS